MRPEVWVQGAVVALAVAQFLIFWYLYRRSRLSSTHEPGRSSAPATADGSPEPPEGSHEAVDHRVACPNCGTVNTARFRYCRDCVAELPRRAGSS